MTTFMVSFGSMYHTEPHPTLGFWPELGDGVLTVEADDRFAARSLIFDLIGKAWCAIYGPDDPPSWGPANLGPLLDALDDPHPTSWTVGCQVTLNADGTLELHMEDVEGDLGEAGAPRGLVTDLGMRLQFYDPDIQWVKR
jgi:hypothetical protein